MTREDVLKDRIRERGPLTVAAFMELALYDSDVGYYARAARRSGRAGDFFTSVDVGPLFGDLLARQIAEMAALLPTAPAFAVVDAGAGDGRLARDIVTALEAQAPGVLAHTSLHLAERSAAARRAQLATFDGSPDIPISSQADLPDRFDGVLVANELLDAMPVHLVAMRPGGLRELFVTVVDGRLTTCEGPPSSEDLARYFESEGVFPLEGALAEVPLAAVAWTHRAARALGAGLLILIDYGHEAAALYSAARQQGTLAAFSRHRESSGADGWLQDAGGRDITADVNFTAIRRAAEAEGCVSLGLMDQTYFLMALAADRLDTFTERQRLAFRTLVTPGGLGSTMKVLVLAKGVGTPALTGCSGAARLT